MIKGIVLILALLLTGCEEANTSNPDPDAANVQARPAASPEYADVKPAEAYDAKKEAK